MIYHGMAWNYNCKLLCFFLYEYISEYDKAEKLKTSLATILKTHIASISLSSNQIVQVSLLSIQLFVMTVTH